MSNIRVTYSGLIAFLVGLLGIITGIIFTILVTRKLDSQELGLWTLIGSLVSYVVIVEPVISYWTSRQIARGEKIGKTAVVLSGIFSIGGSITYFIIAIFVSPELKVDLTPILLASALVPITYLNNTLNGIILGYKPQGVSYGMVAFEVSKLPLGFVLVHVSELGIVGAILATILASLTKTVVLLLLAKEQLANGFSVENIKFWLKLSWIPLYNGGSGLIYSLDVLVYSIITHSVIGLAYWGTASAISNLVSHSGQISHALYPKMIATGKKTFAEENLKRFVFFAIPILFASIVFAKPALHILNPIYADGYLVVIILTIRTFVYVLTNTFYNILSAYETADVDKNTSTKKYLKSRFFSLPTMNYIMTISYVSALGVSLLVIGSSSPELHLVTVWSGILLATSIPFMVYGLRAVRKHYQINLPYLLMLKFSIIAFVSSVIIYYLENTFLIYTESIYDFLPQLIPLIVFGGCIYFGICYISDKSTRDLFKAIINEIKS